MTEKSRTGIPDPDAGRKTRAILEARAAALARPLVEEQEADAITLVAFLAGERSYAVASVDVEHVLARAEVSRLPWVPAAVVGVTNVAGDVLPVVDVERHLGVGACRPGGPILVLGHGGDRFGVLAEAVSDLLVVPRAGLVVPSGDLAGAAGLVVGVTGSTLVLDAGALLAAMQLTAPQQESDDHISA